MEEDKKKKKRNKKNKNKQTKSREEDSDQNSNSQNTNNADLDLDLDTNQLNGALSSSAEEIIKELRKENQSHVHKEATLQETIQHLQKENESYIQKEGTLEETIKQLQNVCDSHRKKEVFLEESIMKLQQINDSHVQKEIDSEMNIIGLHNEKELLLQEKALLEEKINQLLVDKAAMDLKGANLEESIKELQNEKESWILIENSSKETISTLNRDITRLQMQVVELEESRNKLSQEKQQLADSAARLQLHMQNLERNIISSPRSDEVKKQASLEDMNSHIEAAGVLVDKLIMENTELVEKVNELSVKLERQNMTARHSTVIEVSDSVPHSLDNGSISAPKLDSTEDAPINKGKTDGLNADGKPTAPPLLFIEAEDKIDGENANRQPTAPPVFVEAKDSGEIVQIPLADTDVRDFESQAVESEKNTVPLADAPLIGAPFRLVSFVARYVSGADLVNNNTSRSESLA